ncbi:hypothetical protein ABET41_08620 [Metabacillus fastidiosus]|uniref:Uncharacterized protein n=1 Tax=Metabacillus fastidiosus TaxID=1458 RepID=A0ABU6P0A0_9BACI|nr:hypothetical protein [Metabacillus fastidiosus]MED4402520.1 hypothetical protein [Metabacillus fastidiosus]MED4455512.1 hypothetical protein [Metabacillus fastidiosus]MED4461879.1 hypothetical protein [Metabacillus fastidiosus]
MSKQTIGKILVIIGFAIIAVNVIFLKPYDPHSILRWIALALILIGFMFIPTYAPLKNKQRDKKS